MLRAVLRGDTEGLTEAIKRKRLKGVAVALTADDRYSRTATQGYVARKQSARSAVMTPGLLLSHVPNGEKLSSGQGRIFDESCDDSCSLWGLSVT